MQIDILKDHLMWTFIRNSLQVSSNAIRTIIAESLGK